MESIEHNCNDFSIRNFSPAQFHPQPYYPKPFFYHNSSAPYFPSVQLVKPPYFTGRELSSNHDINSLIEHIEITLADQYSCRLIQKQLEEAGTMLASKLFDRMLSNIERYMKMPFGNYLCQKLFERLTEKQLHAIICKISCCAVELSKNLHGTRAVQKLIELSFNSPKLIAILIHSFAGYVTELIMVQIEITIEY